MVPLSCNVPASCMFLMILITCLFRNVLTGANVWLSWALIMEAVTRSMCGPAHGHALLYEGAMFRLIEASSRELCGVTSLEDEVFDLGLSMTPRRRQATPRRNYATKRQK